MNYITTVAAFITGALLAHTVWNAVELLAHRKDRP